jgi:hypothetical protein
MTLFPISSSFRQSPSFRTSDNLPITPIGDLKKILKFVA